MLQYIFLILGIVCLAVFFLLRPKSQTTLQQAQPKQQQKNLGELNVFYASQTGTAAKMATLFAEEASEHGFSGIVISLKQLSHQHFQPNQISIFFMANTGEGEPPENSVIFMRMLAGKTGLQGETPQWNNMNFAVFGLGDSQYEHFNKVGIEADRMLAKLGANRIAEIGLGDANSTMEDDYNEWKGALWPILVHFREQHPYEGITNTRKLSAHLEQSDDLQYLSALPPLYANYRFCIQKSVVDRKVEEEDLDFKTKASLAGKTSFVKSIVERRQNNQQGSSLQLQLQLQESPQYETASNIALWPRNDPQIMSQVLSYFNLDAKTPIDIQILDPNKRTKLNFISPITIGQLVQQYIDLQFRVTKSLLKKLAKFDSKGVHYFMDNSSPKTTDQFRKITDQDFCFLFKLVKLYQVKLSFQDFVELSDSMGPRLFTIASCYQVQKNVVIIASIVKDGLISKNFQAKSQTFKAELRKSSFMRIHKWKKVICIGAGTGFAPFRGYLQEKERALAENKPYPLISLYFGCRKSSSDFIYKEQILAWESQKIINNLQLAFSRDTQNKVYVQNLLEQNTEQLKQFIADPETAMYICGSTGMGKDVVQVVEKASGMGAEQFKKLIAQWEAAGKLVKELW